MLHLSGKFRLRMAAKVDLLRYENTLHNPKPSQLNVRKTFLTENM
jgi:hypothetical protein